MASFDLEEDYLPLDVKSLLTEQQNTTLALLHGDYKKIAAINAGGPIYPMSLPPDRPLEVNGRELLMARLPEFRAGLALTESIGSILRTQRAAGALDPLGEKVGNLLNANETKIHYFFTCISTVENHGFKIIGCIHDDAWHRRIDPQDDRRAYIDGLLREFQNHPIARWAVRSTQPRQTRARFRKTLIKAYNAPPADDADDANDPDGPDDRWCPISRCYDNDMSTKTTHIVDRTIPEHVAQALFGKTADERGHIWQPANGLMMNMWYRKWWDEGVIAIIPAAGEGEFLVIVLAPAKCAKSRIRGFVYGDALQGAKLKFLTGQRPSRKYLWFRFAVTLLRWHRGEFPHITEVDRCRLPVEAQELWRSPEAPFAAPVLFRLACKFGFLPADRAAAFWGMQPADYETSNQEFVDSIVTNLRLALTLDEKANQAARRRRRAWIARAKTISLGMVYGNFPWSEEDAYDSEYFGYDDEGSDESEDDSEEEQEEQEDDDDEFDWDDSEDDGSGYFGSPESED